MISKKDPPTRDSHGVKDAKEDLNNINVPRKRGPSERHESKRHEERAPEHERKLILFSVILVHPMRKRDSGERTHDPINSGGNTHCLDSGPNDLAAHKNSHNGSD